MAGSIPHMRQMAYSQQLIVRGEPLLMLAGEVQNSQFSSAAYMKGVWPRLKAANLNTVFGSVSWEQIEPVEGEFQFGELDNIILDAREHGLHLVLLWFGSFKNSLSTYAPSWVKQNAKRFPRAELRTPEGKHTVGDVLSIFGTEAQSADAAAFAALMKRIKEIDEQHSTVVMVQVENEVGLLGDSRDRSALADSAWHGAVPADLLNWVQRDWPKTNKQFQANFPRLQKVDQASIKAWSSIPGDALFVDELFMAYHYALYVEAVASAGKRAYALPLYTNVWQNYAGEDRDTNEPAIVAGGGKPGDYPCGGGVTNVLDVWKAFAPSLDLIAPDIYLNDYDKSCAAYRHLGQALLIPEQRRDEYGARRVWAAFGSHQCIGTAPFGIDTLDLSENPFSTHYGLLSKVSSRIIAAQSRKNASLGFFFDELREQHDPSPPIHHTFGAWNLTIERSFVFGKPGPGCGIIIPMEDDDFLLIGWGFQVKFESKATGVRFTGILRFEEKEVEDLKTGRMRTLRLLNGDETRSGKFAIMPNASPDYGGFPICVTIPANTGIAMCKPYALLDDDLERRN